MRVITIFSKICPSGVDGARKPRFAQGIPIGSNSTPVGPIGGRLGSGVVRGGANILRPLMGPTGPIPRAQISRCTLWGQFGTKGQKSFSDITFLKRQSQFTLAPLSGLALPRVDRVPIEVVLLKKCTRVLLVPRYGHSKIYSGPNAETLHPFGSPLSSPDPKRVSPLHPGPRPLQ